MKFKPVLILALSVLLIISTMSGCGRIADYIIDEAKDAITDKTTEATNSFFDDMLGKDSWEPANEGIVLNYLSSSALTDDPSASVKFEKYNGTDPLMLVWDGEYLPGDVICHTFSLTNMGDEAADWSIIFTSEKAEPAMGIIDVHYTLSDGSFVNQDSININNMAVKLGTLYSLVTSGDDSLSGTLEGGKSAIVLVSFTIEPDATKDLLSTFDDFSVGVKLG